MVKRSISWCHASVASMTGANARREIGFKLCRHVTSCSLAGLGALHSYISSKASRARRAASRRTRSIPPPGWGTPFHGPPDRFQSLVGKLYECPFFDHEETRGSEDFPNDATVVRPQPDRDYLNAIAIRQSPVENQIRTYSWCNPPRIGRQRMRPALFTVRDRGASLSKAKCVRGSL